MSVPHFRRRVREIDRELSALDPRADHDRVRQLTGDRAVYADLLGRAGHPTPPPIIHW